MKKKSSIYVFFPALLLVLFAGYYWSFSSGYEQKQEAKAAAVRKAKQDKLTEDNRLRLQAVNDAIASQKRRAAEREAKAARLQKEKEELQAAIDARDHARVEANKFRDKYEHLTKDVQAEKEAIAKIKEDKENLTAELDFLQVLTAKTTSNVDTLSTVLNKIAAADAAYEAAAKAAAAAAAKK
jgi:hypothetical protein